MQLSAFFSTTEVVRDAAVAVTFGPGSRRSGSVCYALDPSIVTRAGTNPHIAAIITTAALADTVPLDKGCVLHSQPQLAFYALHNHLFELGLLSAHKESSIDPTARVAPSAFIGKNVVLGPRVVVEHGAVIEDFTMIGEDSYIGPNTSIGGRGIYNTHVGGRNIRVNCAGAVRIGRRCEILSGAFVAKSYLSEFTEIADDVKIGARASVGHGCRVGDASIVGANCVLAGNVTLGRNVWTGPNVSVADGVTLGDESRALIGSVVIQNVKVGETVSGNFALSHAIQLRQFTRLRNEH